MCVWQTESCSLLIRLLGSADVSIIDRTRLWITLLINHHQHGSRLTQTRGNQSSQKYAYMQMRTHINLSTCRQNSCDRYWPPTCPQPNLIRVPASGPALQRDGPWWSGEDKAFKRKIDVLIMWLQSPLLFFFTCLNGLGQKFGSRKSEEDIK